MSYMEKIKGAYNAVKEELGNMGTIALIGTACILGALGVARYCGPAYEKKMNPPAQHQTVTPSQLENMATPEQDIPR